MAKLPATVDAWVAAEIWRNGGRADLFYCKFAHQRFIQGKFAEIGGKDEQTTSAEALHGQSQQGGVVALDIKGIPAALGVGKGGRIHKDQAIAFLVLPQPL